MRSLTVSPVRDPGGEVIGLISVGRDITERKRAEQALRESEDRFRRLVENVADAFYLHDPQGRLLDVNQRACESLGYTWEELLSMRVEDVEQSRSYLGSAGEWSRMVPGTPATVQGVHRRKDGTTFPVEVRLGAFEAGGRPLILAVARDVTERVEAGEALRQSELKAGKVEALQRVDQFRKDLIATVSHELRTPLASIKGYISTLLQRDVKWEPEQWEFLQIVYQQAERLNNLVEDLLTMSRLEAGPLKLAQEPTSLADIIGRVDAQLRPLVSSHRLKVEAPPDLPLFLADRGKIAQVIGNLVSNAAKFSAAGTHISVRARCRDGLAVVSVSDEGGGIPEDGWTGCSSPSTGWRAHRPRRARASGLASPSAAGWWRGPWRENLGGEPAWGRLHL